MFSSILVPLDGSGFGEHALPLAATVARKGGGRVHLAHVHTLLFGGVEQFDSDMDLAARDAERRYLERAAHRLAGARAPADYAVLEGSVVEALEGHVGSLGPDLVVMTTHGRGPLSRFWLGSVADQLLRRLTVPVLLVRPHGDPPDPAGDVAIRHVLVPLDGSPLAEEVLPEATALGVLAGARFTLLRVVSPPAYGFEPATMAAPLVSPTVIDGMVGQARDYLEGMAGPMRERGLDVRARVVIDAGPAAGILEEARAGGCDLIALTTHGRHGLPRLFLGSVADKVVRGADAPVLVLRGR
jgi:nucleotide-binding universal stress UspA family protein